MPIFEFKCISCGDVSETICSQDVKVRECPKCKGEARKLFPSKVGLVFKGDGFYITDYKNKADKPKDKQSSEADS